MIKNGKEEQKLPGLDFTNRQMFWMTWARMYCQKYSSDMIETILKFDNGGKHSFGKYRILGPLKNLPQFSDDFNCPIGSPMNPEKKCTLW